MKSKQSELDTPKPGVSGIKGVCAKLPQWLDALKPHVTEPILVALEGAMSRVVTACVSNFSVDGYRALAVAARAEARSDVDQLCASADDLHKLTRGKRPAAVVLKHEAQKAKELLDTTVNIVQGLEVMEPVGELIASPRALLKNKDVQQSLLDFLGASGDSFAGDTSDELQAASFTCWKALATCVLAWGADPGDVQDGERVTVLLGAAKRLDRLLLKKGREYVMTLMDSACQLRTRMVGTSAKVFVTQDSAKPDTMHIQSIIDKCRASLDECAEEKEEPEEAEVDEAAESFLQDMKDYCKTALDDAVVFLAEVKRMLLEEEAEKLRALKSSGEKLVGTAKKGVWQNKAGRSAASTEEPTWEELELVAKKSLLKGEYASKVDSWISKVDKDTSGLCRHPCKA